MDDIDLKRIGGLVIVVLVASAIASFGFNAVSVNPAIPETDLVVRDAPGPGELNTTDTVRIFSVEHVGGDAVPMGELSIVIGTRASGLQFHEVNNWTDRANGVTYVARVNGGSIRSTDDFQEGDIITVRKTAGSFASGDTYEVHVRVFHRPSEAVLADEMLEID